MIRIIVLSVCFSLLSCNETKTNSSEELKKHIIEKYENVHTTLLNGNSDYVLSLHTDDAVQFLPDGSEVNGIEALTEFYKKVAASRIDIKSTPISVEKLSDTIAFEVGVYNSTNSTGKESIGKYIIIWERTDGDWKILKAIDQAKLWEGSEL